MPRAGGGDRAVADAFDLRPEVVDGDVEGTGEAVLDVGRRGGVFQHVDAAEALGGCLQRRDELMHRIALGQTIAVLPRSLTTPLRDDLASVPVADVPASTLALAWPAHSTSPAVAALARAVADSRL